MTPDQQHTIFMEYINYYMNLFQLLRWEFFDHYGIENKHDKDFIKDGGAAVNINCLQRTVQIYFYPFKKKEHQNIEYIKETAFHEILHVLLMPLGEKIDIQHEIINTIIHGLQIESQNKIVRRKNE